MSYEQRGHMPLQYDPVAYPGSVLRFRGPVHDVDAPHVLCLGGSETFGRFIHAPFAAQLDDLLDGHVVNMGVMNAGLDVLMQDAAITMALRHARAVVLQITGAQNMTNRFYAVHPRRNDRFLKATTMLKTIYPEVDFTEFHFTRHLLTHLKATSQDRFAILVEELRTAWLARMMRLLKGIEAPVHLLWLSRRAPDAADRTMQIGDDPLFIDRVLLDKVAAQAASLTIAVPQKDRATRPNKGMFFAAGEEAAARALPGPDAHDLAALALRDLLA
jgi:hypothetical protein